MKRVWNFSEFEKCLRITGFSLHTYDRITKPSVPIRFICQNATQTPHTNENRSDITTLVPLFTVKRERDHYAAGTRVRQMLRGEVHKLKNELLRHNGDVDKIDEVLKENGSALFRSYPDGSAVLELLNQLNHSPYLALEVFGWRRLQLDDAAPMTIMEYSNGISIAGRLNNIDLAVELFKEASNKQLKGTSVFNALMSAYSYNGLIMKCQSLFREFKMDPVFTPSITTYNILISAYGRLVLVDHMEAIYREIKDLKLDPTVYTYRGLISGYITAWKWKKMEKAYRAMKASHVEPNLDIHLLMLRGYALAGNLKKMEKMYEMVLNHGYHNEIQVILVMITAYCRSSDAAKVQKVEQLLRKIPQNQYRPWLNVAMICLYAKEDLLEKMEKSINEAFEHETHVRTVGAMNSIISSYFRHDAIDKLADFVKRAELAGWKSCRSLYHCQMVLYSSEKRLSEMERVLDEMSRINMHLSIKTYWILIKAYSRWGERSKLEQVLGMMWKHGYNVQLGSGS